MTAARQPLILLVEDDIPFRRSVTAYLELQNATNRTNVFFYTWNPKRRAVAAVPQVRRLPIAGVNVKF